MLEISLHILDIAENSTRAGATMVSILVTEDTGKNSLLLEIRDNGAGMDEEVLSKSIDPMFTTKSVRNVGLGLPMLAQAVEMTKGKFGIESQLGKGTKIVAEFTLDHLDRQPMGDVAATLVTLIAGNPDVEFIYRHARDNREFYLDTREIKHEIESVPITHGDILQYIRNQVRDGLHEIGSMA